MLLSLMKRRGGRPPPVLLEPDQFLLANLDGSRGDVGRVVAGRVLRSGPAVANGDARVARQDRELVNAHPIPAAVEQV